MVGIPEGWIMSHKMSVPLVPHADFKEYAFDLSKAPDWKGTIAAVMFETPFRKGEEAKGEIKLRGLHEPVEVLRDRWGIAHIYARMPTICSLPRASSLPRIACSSSTAGGASTWARPPRWSASRASKPIASPGS